MIKISSLNVRGLHDVQKRRDIFCYLRNKKFQINCLQDTLFSESLDPYIRAEWGGEAVFSSFSTNQRGVCILFNNDFEYKILQVKADGGGNYLLLDVEVERKRFTLVTVYGPNEDTPDFYVKVAESIEEIGNETCIICGDFNLVQDQDLDTFNYLHVNNPKAKECLWNIKDEFNLVDPYRELNETARRYTWRKPNPLKQARLDFFLVSECFMSSIKQIDILPSYRSDHSPIVLLFQVNDFKKGKGLWKFNNSLLKDIEYANIVKQCIQQTKEQYMVPIYSYEYVRNNQNLSIQLTISDQLFLEVLLTEIRGKTIFYSAYKKKQKNLREAELQQEIELLEEKEPLDLNQIEGKKMELEMIRKEKIQGLLIRSRLRWAEEGEKPTKYFCSLESRNYINKTIPKVIKDDGNIISKQEEILNEIQLFYSTLYKNYDHDADVNIENVFDNLKDHPILTEEEKMN